MANWLDALRGFLTQRRLAYLRTFNVASADVEKVLVDLSRFCRAHKSTGHTDPYMAARLDGRREVWIRIQQHLQLSDEVLWQLYGGKPNTNQEV